MTTTTDTAASSDPCVDPAPPAGATVDFWGMLPDGHGGWGAARRCAYGERHEGGRILTRARVLQWTDGSIETYEGGGVYVAEVDARGDEDERFNLSITEARQLAHTLLAAADTAERWVSQAG